MLQGETHRFIITNINNEGEGVVRTEDECFVLFVPDALPGEEVTCRIVRIKKNYGLAKVLDRHCDSPDRILPRCPHFGRCGGCQLQHMTYEAQLKLKTRAVYDALTRIGGMAEPPVEECIASPSQWGYRNKAVVPVRRCNREQFAAGFFRPRSHDIIRLRECKVLLPELEKKLLKIIAILRETVFVGYDEKAKDNVTNFIRHIVLREGNYSKESLCAIVGTKKLSVTERKKLSGIFVSAFSHLNGLIYNRNSSTGNFIWGDDFIYNRNSSTGNFIWGDDFIYNRNSSTGNFIWGDDFEQVCGVSEMEEYLGKYKFRFEISSFFQINSEQTLRLYNKAAELALGNSPKRILELYSGVGSLTSYLAAGAKNVTAVESWQAAAAYIGVNAKRNDLKNIEVYSGKSEDIISDLKNVRYDTIRLYWILREPVVFPKS